MTVTVTVTVTPAGASRGKETATGIGCRQPATPNPSKVCFEEFWKLLDALSRSSCTSTAFRPHTQPG